LGVYSRPTVPGPVNTGDSHSCDRPTSVPDRPKRPAGPRTGGLRTTDYGLNKGLRDQGRSGVVSGRSLAGLLQRTCFAPVRAQSLGSPFGPKWGEHPIEVMTRVSQSRCPLARLTSRSGKRHYEDFDLPACSGRRKAALTHNLRYAPGYGPDGACRGDHGARLGPTPPRRRVGTRDDGRDNRRNRVI
jgi:hypothetical protein